MNDLIEATKSARHSWRATQRRNRRALAASVAFHIAALVGLWGSASGDLTATLDDGGEQAGMSVSLVKLSDLSANEPASAQGNLTPLFAKLHNDLAPVSVDPSRRPPAPMSELLQMLRSREPQPPPPQTKATRETAVTTSAANPQLPDSPKDGEGAKQGAGAKAGSTGTLWGAIEPCWRNLGVTSPLPVILEVSLDARGRLSTPPTIIRPSVATVGEARLKAEAAALSALSACLPRGDLRFAGRSHRVEFRAR